MMTKRGVDISDKVLRKYFAALIGQFYKILPIKESGEPSLCKYMESLQRELLGCNDLIVALNHDELFLSLLSILQYQIENDCDIDTVKTDVFKAISLCKKLENKYNHEVRHHDRMG